MNTKRFASFILPILSSVVGVSLLVVLLSACAFVGPVYAAVIILLTENFDAPTPPNLPNGWNVTDVSGTQGDWTTMMGTWHPSGYQAHSLPNVAVFNSWTASTGSSTRLFRTTGINFGSVKATLTFWMFHDGQYSNNDTIQLQVSIDGGTTWNNVGSAVSRYIAGTYAWSQHTVDLSAYSGQTDVRIGFLATGAYGNDCHIDDIEVDGVPTGGTLEGTVADAVRGLPINGATIEISGPSTQTTTTNGSGFYSFPSLPAGSYAVTASRSGYGDRTASDVLVVDGYITTQDFGLMPLSAIGVFRNGSWYLDTNGNGAWDGPSTDASFSFGIAGDLPAVGNWNGTPGSVGVFRTSKWYLDWNGNDQWDGSIIDKVYTFGLAGDLAVAGDWNGTGRTKVGVFRNGKFYLDYNGNEVWEGCLVDKCYTFGLAGDIPVVGDWDGDGHTEIGVFRNGIWYLDYDGSGSWNGCSVDKCYSFGLAGDMPVAGDWDGSSLSKIGVKRGASWYLDNNGNGAWDGSLVDKVRSFGLATDKPVTGIW